MDYYLYKEAYCVYLNEFNRMICVSRVCVDLMWIVQQANLFTMANLSSQIEILIVFTQ